MANTQAFNLDGKDLLVTGGTGSFGRRFIASVLERYRPNRLIVFSRDELKQWLHSWSVDASELLRARKGSQI